MSDTSGPTSPKRFATFDPDSSSWRTWPVIALWGSDEFSETWPPSGTWDLGAAYERPTSEPAITASGSSLLPTPTARDWKDKGEFTPHPEKHKLPHAIRDLLLRGAFTVDPLTAGGGVLGRRAPHPVDDVGWLSPVFVEWMMGLPAGWVTDVIGVPRDAQLEILGRGVVPAQAEAALRLMLAAPAEFVSPALMVAAGGSAA